MTRASRGWRPLRPAGPPRHELVRREADGVVCLYAPARFFSVGAWYESFAQVDDSDVIRLIGESRRSVAAAPAAEPVRGA